MKLILISILIVLSTLVACQDYNSNSSDAIKYGPVVLDETDPNFPAAYNVIQNRCVNCHSSNIHNVWASYKDNNAWLDSGLINRGDAANSYFIQRIINSGGASANMPQGGSSLPTAEYEALINWVDNIP